MIVLTAIIHYVYNAIFDLLLGRCLR